RAGGGAVLRREAHRRSLLGASQDQRLVDLASIHVGGDDGFVLLGLLAAQEQFQLSLAQTDFAGDQYAPCLCLVRQHFQEDVLGDQHRWRSFRRLLLPRVPGLFLRLGFLTVGGGVATRCQRAGQKGQDDKTKQGLSRGCFHTVQCNKGLRG